MHPPIVSGENLLQAYSNTSKKCPTLKTSRLLESENQNFENTEVKDHLNKVKEFLGKPSVEKTVCLSQAQWIPELKCAKVLKKVGKKWNYFGHRFMGNDVLYPEEAAYLLEISDLELLHTGVPLSLQSGFSLLLNNDTGCTLFEYRVFAHFVTFGFRVFRHDPTLIEEELTPSSKLTEIPDSTSAGSSVEVQVHSNNATKFKTKFTLDLLNDKETWKSFLDKLYHDETSAKVSAEVNENVDQSLSTANENAPPPSNSDILPSGTGDKTEPSNNEPLSDTITVQPSEEPLLKSTEKPSDETSSDKSTEKPTGETSSDRSTEKPSDETASDESTEKTLSEKNTEQSSGPCAILTVASESSEEAESEDEKKKKSIVRFT
uniref:tRNA-splicing endonuclease subunit Sen54 n=1 Tax=Cacopsylla melanoneura TaxID=428564 RepID=A0A8D9EMK8_9HEMI